MATHYLSVHCKEKRFQKRVSKGFLEGGLKGQKTVHAIVEGLGRKGFSVSYFNSNSLMVHLYALGPYNLLHGNNYKFL